MYISQTSKHLFVKILILIAIIVSGLAFSIQNTHAEAIEISTAEELTSYFSSGGAVKLIDDITITSNAFITADTTIDLNGHTISMGENTLVPSGATLTIEDSSEGGAGTIASDDDIAIQVGGSTTTGNLILNGGNVECQGTHCICNYDTFIMNGGTVSGESFVIYNLKDFTLNDGYITSEDLTVTNRAEGASFIMNGGTVETTSEDYIAITLAVPNTSFVMNDGLITAMNHIEDGSDGGTAIAGFKYTDITINGGTINAYSNAIMGNGSWSGNSEGTSAAFTVNGGTITSQTGAGIYAPQVNGITTITGGTITGLTGIEIRAGTLNVSGGTITGTGEYEVSTGVSGLSTNGAAISVVQHSTAQPITVNITGGDFIAEYPISFTNPTGYNQSVTNQVNIEVSGGEFTGENLDDVINNLSRGFTNFYIDESSGTSTIKIIPTNIAGYYLSVNTSGSIDILGPSHTTQTDYSEINVLSNCRNGYNVTMSTSVNDNNLYLNSTSSSPYHISPIEDSVSLISALGTWGYFISNDQSITPTGTDLFHPVPASSSSPAILRTASSTASNTDIDDTFRVYFGANLGGSLAAGSYRMISDNSGAAGSILYQITADPACTVFPIGVDYNENIDGAGGEGDDSTENPVANFPDSSENILRTDEHDVTTIKLSNKIPQRNHYTFVEWNTNPSGTGLSFQPNDVITVGTDPGELTGEITLYAIWTAGCSNNTICYNGNGADAGTMESQTADGGTGVALRASNFSRTGYGFAGWNTKSDGSGSNYGPQENVAVPQVGGVNLFANWIPSAGSLQTWTGASSMDVGDITALTDERDGETYAVAKLADGNVWIIENLRLNPQTASITLLNTNNPTTSFMTDAHASSSSTTLCKTSNASCIDTISYNTNNLDRTLTQSPTNNDDSSAWYSYGVLYNWYTATAGNGTYSFTDTSGTNSDGTVSGDICPAGWHLPTGNNGEYVALNTAVSGSINRDISLRSFANNFIRGGDYNGNAPTNRGTQGRYWTSTASSQTTAYRFGYDSSSVTPNNTYSKWDAFAVRCIYDGNRIPTSTVTVNIDEHVTSISLHNDTYGDQQVTATGSTVTLVNGESYTISAIFEEGYTVNAWTTTSDGQIATPTSVSTTYTVTDTATLSLASKVATLTTFTINYDTTPSTDTITSDVATSYNVSYTFTITDTVPVIFGSTFIGWSENSSALTVDYAQGDNITLTNSDPDNVSSVSKTLYAVYQTNTCPTNSICYFGNGANSGTMSNQSATSSTSTMLIAPNYARTGYGFAGWITSENATPYGPNATITTPDLSTSGLMLYAKWVPSAGDLQDWNGCSSMNTGDVTALTDTRDSNTYLVSKLADNNCWITENLRLNPSTATITAQNTNAPTNTFVTEAPNSTPSNTLCNSNNATCDNKPQYNLNNLNRSLTQSYDASSNSSAWYGYGAYYNWYTATAGNGTFEFTNTSGTNSDGIVSGDICPAGWRLPTGGSSGEYKALNIAINNGATNTSVAWRNYPNNFVFSGEYKNTTRSGTYSQARIWTANANSNNEAFRMGLDIKNTLVTPEKFFNKWDGLVVRCINTNS